VSEDIQATILEVSIFTESPFEATSQEISKAPSYIGWRPFRPLSSRLVFAKRLSKFSLQWVFI
jgi:hypothetical protein